MGFISKHWDLLADKYNKNSKEDRTGGFAFEKYVNIPSIFSLFPKNASNVLDLGCGNGIFTVELAKIFPNVVGIDISKKMLKEAKKIGKGVSFIQHDLEKPFPKFDFKFDLITAKLLLMYIDDLEGFVKECYKIMEKKGVLLVSVRHPLRWNYEKDYTNYFSEKTVMHKIGGGKSTEVFYIHRTLETYINTFRVNGFHCDLIEEPKVIASFMIEYPLSEWRDGVPRRLNLRFVKQ
jgi:ubiquinone/menaquinone biosynthesis C-methylase UbiE